MKPAIILIAHNIRSLWNIGSFFRTADAFGVAHIHLTGYTALPPREEISKTALGAENTIPWSTSKDPITVIDERRREGYEIVALEITGNSLPLSGYFPKKPVCLIVGHEVLGVSDALLKASDTVVHIPMFGKKESLNVSVALGIALYHLKH
ncbi:RNA methyltransferase [Candidatus Peribacteria bacterium]|nr:RNA methyltransferase [Candidatus Peribacteria bacterium]